jgi:hypothetical protein
MCIIIVMCIIIAASHVLHASHAALCKVETMHPLLRGELLKSVTANACG